MLKTIDTHRASVAVRLGFHRQASHTFLEEQLEDVRSTRRELARVIAAVDTEIQNVFSSAFTSQAITTGFDRRYGVLKRKSSKFN